MLSVNHQSLLSNSCHNREQGTTLSVPKEMDCSVLSDVFCYPKLYDSDVTFISLQSVACGRYLITLSRLATGEPRGSLTSAAMGIKP
jgi:hypothetical protein